MSEKKPISAGKRLMFIGVTLLFFFLLIEIIFSVFYYHRYGNSKLATVEFMMNVRNGMRPKLTPYNPENQKLVQPDSSAAFNDGVTKKRL